MCVLIYFLNIEQFIAQGWVNALDQSEPNILDPAYANYTWQISTLTLRRRNPGQCSLSHAGA